MKGKAGLAAESAGTFPQFTQHSLQYDANNDKPRLHIELHALYVCSKCWELQSYDLGGSLTCLLDYP